MKKSKNVKIKFKLKKNEKSAVQKILSRGKESVRVIKRARILELFDQGHTSPTIAEYVGVKARTVRNIGWKYLKGDLKNALYEKPRPGKKRSLNEKQASQIIAMVCSDPPSGRSRWTVRLLTEEVIKRKIISSVGRETVRLLLKTHDLKPWREKNVVYTGINE